MFIEFINKGWGILPNVQEVTNIPLFQYLTQHTQCTAAAAGGAEESKRDSAPLSKETAELEDVFLDETSDSNNQQRCFPSRACTIM